MNPALALQLLAGALQRVCGPRLTPLRAREGTERKGLFIRLIHETGHLCIDEPRSANVVLMSFQQIRDLLSCRLGKDRPEAADIISRPPLGTATSRFLFAKWTRQR
jgi:hypothetical protein